MTDSSINRGGPYHSTPESALHKAWENCRKLKQYIASGRPPQRDMPFAAQYAKHFYSLARSIREQGGVLTSETAEDVKEFVATWEDETLLHVSAFDPQALSNSLYAHAMLGIAPEAGWFAAWRDAAQAKMAQFKPQELSNSFYAHAMLGIAPEAGWFAAWRDAAQAKMAQFKPQELSNSFYAHAMLGIAPEAGWFAAWRDAAKAKMAQFNSQALSNSLYAHAMLGIAPEAGWFAAWQDAAEAKMAQFKPQDLSNSLYALAMAHAVFGLPVSEALLAGFDQEVSRCRPDRVEQTAQIDAAYKAFLRPLPAGIVVDASRIRAFTDKKGESSLERDFRAKLAPLARMKPFKIEPEIWSDASMSYIDFVLTPERPANGRGSPPRLFVQLDGPTHYVRQPDGSLQLDGSTRLQTCLLEKALAPDGLLRIGFEEFNRNPRAAAEKAVAALQALAERQKQAPPPSSDDASGLPPELARMRDALLKRRGNGAASGR